MLTITTYEAPIGDPASSRRLTQAPDLDGAAVHSLAAKWPAQLVVCVLKGPNGQNEVRLAIDYCHVNKFAAGDGLATLDIYGVPQKVGRAK